MPPIGRRRSDCPGPISHPERCRAAGRREHEVPFSAAVRALTVPSNWSEFGQTPQFRQGPDSSRRGYYSVRSATREDKGTMAPLLPNARKHNLRRLAQEIHSATACLSASRAAICKQVGLNVAQWRALAAIDRSTFVLSISDLARLLRRSRQSMHPLACGLERAGWVRFLPNPDDRRLLHMQITARGKSIVSAAEGSFNTWLLTMASDLSDHDLGKLADTMRAIHERIARARDYV